MGRPYGKGCSVDLPESSSGSKELSLLSSESELCTEDGGDERSSELAQVEDVRLFLDEGDAELVEGSPSDSRDSAEFDTRVFFCFLYQLDCFCFRCSCCISASYSLFFCLMILISSIISSHNL